MMLSENTIVKMLNSLMTTDAGQVGGFILIIALGFVYFGYLRKSSTEYCVFQRRVFIGFVLIVLAHTVLDSCVIHDISKSGNPDISYILIAVIHSLELFLFQTHLFDNGYHEYLFGTLLPSEKWSEGQPILVFLYVLLFILAVITSCWVLIRILSRRGAGRAWLRRNQTKKVFVFFGGDKRAKLLAKDLKESQPEVKLLYVADYDPEAENVGMSVWDIIKRRLLGRKTVNFEPFDAVVFAKVPLKDVEGTDIGIQMGLKDLSGILANKDCNVFLLSDDTNANLHCASILQQSGCKAEIYCRACREGVNRIYEEAMSMTPDVSVHLVDESYLAVRILKSTNELLPVNFVEKGKDLDGQGGWVNSAFNSLILGFGERGQEVLGFLYEYGAFVNKDFQKSAFSCTAMDAKMDKIAKDFRVRYPGLKEEKGVHYEKCEVGSDSFWSYLDSSIMGLNYIVVCLGDDRLNLNIASEILTVALRKGKDLAKNFVILVAQEESEYLNTITVNHLNSIPQYHKCVHCFGGLEPVWKYQVITDAVLIDKAKDYYYAYKKAADPNWEIDKEALWNKREQQILMDADYGNRMNLIRQRSQDYANVLHAATKLALVVPEILACRKEIAGDIPNLVAFKSEHYSGSDAHVRRVLKYLAVLEHIRWEASHAAMGYVEGEKKDAVKKTHQFIKPFKELDAKTQHYDYLVVRTTFELF